MAGRRQSPGPRQSPGSQTSLRKRNQQRIVEALVKVGASTQADLARRTGLSTATISNIVSHMAENGLVSLTPTTASGRRATSVRLLSSNGTVAAGIGFGRRHLRVVLVYPDYTIVAEESIALPPKYDPRVGFDLARDLLGDLLERTGISWDALSGVGVGIPGSIDRRDVMPVIGTVWAEWAFVDVVVELEDRLGGIPVVLDNDANLGSVAETIWGPHGHVTNLVYLKVGSGIGAGLILNGMPFNGATGVTGEVGHVQVVADGQACRCGNRGCLEAEASITAMLDRLSAVTSITTTEELVAAAKAGDVAVIRVIEDAARMIGRVVGDLASILSPEIIVLGGPLAALGDTILEPISRAFARHVLPLVRDATEIVASTLDDRGEALGAAALVFHREAVRVL
ncbi:ROK family transcriptional regulator [Frondihabitans cladoniiphilus]|uniref:ROK family transcriptional regulator n=2 Tax=Frondihabitans cladoniiphilus TaxID=715785 RepID=A0ABP8VUD3_9MICO